MDDFERKLRAFLFDIDDDTLLDEANKRLFKYVGTDCVEELSLDFQGNLFLVFFKLASIENYNGINEPEVPVTIEAALAKKGLSKEAQKLRKQTKYEGMTIAKSSSESLKEPGARLYEDLITPLAEKPSMFSVKQIVNQYGGDWTNFFESKKLHHKSLIENLKSRIQSAYVPTYERVIKRDDLVEYTAELFDLALEMAVCASVAYREKHKDVAWTALSKAKELLGLYVGVRAHLEKNEKVAVKEYKKVKTKAWKRADLHSRVVAQLGKLKEQNWRPRHKDKSSFEYYLILELARLMESAKFNGFDLTGVQSSVEQVSTSLHNQFHKLKKEDSIISKLVDELYALSEKESKGSYGSQRAKSKHDDFLEIIANLYSLYHKKNEQDHKEDLQQDDVKHTDNENKAKEYIAQLFIMTQHESTKNKVIEHRKDVSDYVIVDKEQLHALYKEHGELNASFCSKASDCPVLKKKQDLHEKVKKFISDPLYTA